MSQVRVIDRNQDRILFHLKTRGPRTASEIGRRFGMTAAGARQHLLNLQATGLVKRRMCAVAVDDRRKPGTSPNRAMAAFPIVIRISPSTC